MYMYMFMYMYMYVYICRSCLTKSQKTKCPGAGSKSFPYWESLRVRLRFGPGIP